MAAFHTYQAQHARTLPACTAAAEESNENHQCPDGDKRYNGGFDDGHILVNTDYFQVVVDVRSVLDPDTDAKDPDACHLVDTTRNKLVQRKKHHYCALV